MVHHKPPTKVDTAGRKVRLRHDRKGSPTTLTKAKRSSHYSNPPNPNPDGGKPTTAWVMYEYPLERKGRKRRAEAKRQTRRAQMRRDKRDALNESKGE